MEVSLDNLSQIGWTVLATVIGALGVYLTTLARSAVRAFTEKIGLQSGNELEALVMELVTQGISYAEQEAKKQSQFAGGTIDNAYKLETATRFIVSQVSKTPSIPDMSAAEVQSKIEAVLGLQNMARGQGEEDAENSIP